MTRSSSSSPTRSQPASSTSASISDVPSQNSASSSLSRGRTILHKSQILAAADLAKKTAHSKKQKPSLTVTPTYNIQPKIVEEGFYSGPMLLRASNGSRRDSGLGDGMFKASSPVLSEHEGAFERQSQRRLSTSHASFAPSNHSCEAFQRSPPYTPLSGLTPLRIPQASRRGSHDRGRSRASTESGSNSSWNPQPSPGSQSSDTSSLHTWRHRLLRRELSATAGAHFFAMDALPFQDIASDQFAQTPAKSGRIRDRQEYFGMTQRSAVEETRPRLVSVGPALVTDEAISRAPPTVLCKSPVEPELLRLQALDTKELDETIDQRQSGDHNDSDINDATGKNSKSSITAKLTKKLWSRALRSGTEVRLPSQTKPGDVYVFNRRIDTPSEDGDEIFQVVGHCADVPDHLPNSPLCPIHPKHFGGSKLMCVMHGPRRRILRR